MIAVKYFARFREELGTSNEQVDGADVTNVESLLIDLRARGGAWARLFAQDQRIMMAVNQELADRETPIKDGDEVALFPPVTGG